VTAHERFHSTLVDRAPSAMPDPAKDVEKGLPPDRQALRSETNSILGTAVVKTSEATSEDNAEREILPDFRPGGCIDYPALNSPVRGCFLYFPTSTHRRPVR
jgi:hypothetical protein